MKKFVIAAASSVHVPRNGRTMEFDGSGSGRCTAGC
jgi:hypothetical protein